LLCPDSSSSVSSSSFLPRSISTSISSTGGGSCDCHDDPVDLSVSGHRGFCALNSKITTY
jgi:hypothetical protein